METYFEQSKGRIKECLLLLAERIDDTSGNLNVQKEFKAYLDDATETEINDSNLDETFIIINPSIKFVCETCDFLAKTQSGLKTHKMKKHKNKTDKIWQDK